MKCCNVLCSFTFTWQRFVFLPNCGHTIEVEGLDHWMDMKEEKEIQMKGCPRCKTMVRDCYRYGNVLKRNMKDIVLVKQKLLANRERQQDFAQRILPKWTKIVSSIDSVFTVVRHPISTDMRDSLNGIQSMLTPRLVKNKPVYDSIDADQRFLIEVQFDIAERIVELVKKSSVQPNRQMKPELLQQILDRSQLVFVSSVQRHHMSKEDYDDVVQEMERLSLVRAFFLLKSAPSYESHSNILTTKKQVEDLLIFNLKKLEASDKVQLKTILERLGTMLSTGLGIDETERQQIVKALGMRQGHWFKCPNGHIYLITECGGAMQEGRCNECGAIIGGGSHTLRRDNRLASEMDGARYAAWSDQNNMANYGF